MIELTANQAAYLEYIRQHLESHQCLPTIAETAERFGVTGTAANDVFQYLVKKKALIKVHRSTKGRFKIAGVKVVLVDEVISEGEAGEC